MRKINRKLVLVAATAGLIQIAGISQIARGANGTWNGSTDNLWTTAANWDGSVPNASGDDAIFNTPGAGNLNVLANTGTLTVRSLTFDSDATSPVTLNIGNGAAAQFFIIAGHTGDDVIVQAGNHVIQGNGGTSFADLKIGAGGGASEGFTFNIADGASLDIAARLAQQNSGNQYFKTGGGTLTLSMNNGGGGGWNDSNGTFSVNGGVLVLSNSGATGNSGNKFTVNDGAVLELQANYGSNNGILTLNDGGTLRSVGGNHSLNSGNGTVLLNGASTTIDVVDSTLTISQDISGAGGFTKQGAGILVLNDGGANPASNFTGPVTISAGTLALGATGSTGSSSLVNVQSGAAFDVSANPAYAVQNGQTLGGNGTVYGSTSVNAGGSLAPGLVGSAGTLSFVNDLTLNGGRVQLDLANTTAAGASDLISVAGNLNLNSSTRLAIGRLNGALAGNSTYTLMTYGGALSGSATNLVVPTVRQGLTVVDPATTPGQIQISVGAGSAASLTWVGDGASNVWDVNNAPNWSGAADQKYFDWDDVTFSDSGSNSPQVDIEGTLVPNSVTVNAGKDYTFGGSGGLLNVNTFSKSGAGAATLSNAGGNQLNSVGVSGGALNFATADNIGSLTVSAGSANFTSTATGSVASLAVNGGAVTLQNGSATSFGDGAVASGAQVNVLGNGTFGSLSIASGGTVTVGDGVSGGAGAISGAITNDGALVLNRPDDFTFSAAISGGSGTIEKRGAGAATFSGNSSGFAGAVSIVAGTILPTNSGALGNTSAGTVTISNGAALDLNSGANGDVLNFGARVFHVQGTGTGAGVIVNSGSTRQFSAFQNIALDGDATFSGFRFDIGRNGTGDVLELNGHRLTLNFSGSQPMFGIESNATVTSGTIELAAGALDLERNVTIHADAQGSNILFDANTNLQLFEPAAGGITRPMVFAGGNLIGDGSSNAATLDSPLTLHGSVTLQPQSNGVGNTTGTGTLVLNGNIVEEGGSFSVNKEGPNTAILNGQSSYTGGTNVNNGALVLGNGNAIGTGTLTIAGGATLRFADGVSAAAKVAELANTGTLDMNGGALAVDYADAAPSPLNDLRSQIISGYASGAWNGPGINSTRAAADSTGAHKTAIGYGEASAVLGAGGGTFAGQSVDGSAVLARYTYSGDANLDGKVDTLDFNALAGNFGGSSKIWTQADFNYDGTVDTLDFNFLASNFGQQISAGTRSAAAGNVAGGVGTVVPEPSGLMLLGIAAAGLSGRHRRRREDVR